MEPDREEEQDPSLPPAEALLQCPLCAGVLIPVREGYRCLRCKYVFCVGCEAAAAD
jgi:hypothetical protein